MAQLTYASVCDGIGAVHVAWRPLGWKCAWVSEIDPFPIRTACRSLRLAGLVVRLERTIAKEYLEVNNEAE